jgi:hypothetical protein
MLLGVRPSFTVHLESFPAGGPDPYDLWLDVLDLLPCHTVAALWVRLALHVNPFGTAVIRPFYLPWFNHGSNTELFLLPF